MDTSNTTPVDDLTIVHSHPDRKTGVPADMDKGPCTQPAEEAVDSVVTAKETAGESDEDNIVAVCPKLAQSTTSQRSPKLTLKLKKQHQPQADATDAVSGKSIPGEAESRAPVVKEKQTASQRTPRLTLKLKQRPKNLKQYFLQEAEESGAESGQSGEEEGYDD